MSAATALRHRLPGSHLWCPIFFSPFPLPHTRYVTRYRAVFAVASISLEGGQVFLFSPVLLSPDTLLGKGNHLSGSYGRTWEGVPISWHTTWLVSHSPPHRSASILSMFHVYHAKLYAIKLFTCPVHFSLMSGFCVFKLFKKLNCVCTTNDPRLNTERKKKTFSLGPVLLSVMLYTSHVLFCK